MTIKKNLDLEIFLNKSKNYKYNLPFPYCVIDNIWNNKLLKDAEQEINNFKNWDGEKKFYGSVGKRFCNTISKLPSNVKKIMETCNSSEFISCLEKITGEEGIIPDPYFEGGGIHSTINKGFLKMHTDFNWYSKLKLYRRLNFIIYLNSDWEEDWGGHLKLGLREKKEIKIYKEITPIINRSILFTTTDSTYHGHPDFLNSPPERSRNSIAIYYYLSERPKGTAFIKKTGTTYRNIDNGKEYIGKKKKKQFPDKIKSLFNLFNKKNKF